MKALHEKKINLNMPINLIFTKNLVQTIWKGNFGIVMKI